MSNERGGPSLLRQRGGKDWNRGYVAVNEGEKNLLRIGKRGKANIFPSGKKVQGGEGKEKSLRLQGHTSAARNGTTLNHKRGKKGS